MFSVADCAGLHGHIKVSPADGTVYVPLGNCVETETDGGRAGRRGVAGQRADVECRSACHPAKPAPGIRLSVSAKPERCTSAMGTMATESRESRCRGTRAGRGPSAPIWARSTASSASRSRRWSPATMAARRSRSWARRTRAKRWAAARVSKARGSCTSPRPTTAERRGSRSTRPETIRSSAATSVTPASVVRRLRIRGTCSTSWTCRSTAAGASWSPTPTGASAPACIAGVDKNGDGFLDARDNDARGQSRHREAIGRTRAVRGSSIRRCRRRPHRRS